MEDVVRAFVLHTSVLIEGIAALVVGFAALYAIVNVLVHFRNPRSPLEIRLGLGRWLALALEFLVAADILRTAVAPTWTEIGQLGAIVALRTILNFFLEREIRAGQESVREDVKTENVKQEQDRESAPRTSRREPQHAY